MHIQAQIESNSTHCSCREEKTSLQSVSSNLQILNEDRALNKLKLTQKQSCLSPFLSKKFLYKQQDFSEFAKHSQCILQRI